MSHIIVSPRIKVLTGIVIWPSTLALWPTSQSCDLSLPVHTTWPAAIWIATLPVQSAFTYTVAIDARLPLTVHGVPNPQESVISVWVSTAGWTTCVTASGALAVSHIRHVYAAVGIMQFGTEAESGDLSNNFSCISSAFVSFKSWREKFKMCMTHNKL